MIRFGRGRSLRHTRLQAVLAVAAIAAAVALPVVLISVGGGVSAHELANIENAGYQIVVSAAGLHGVADAHGLASKILGLSSVTAASPVLSVGIDAFPRGNGTPPAAVLAEGIVPGQFPPTLGPSERGLFPSPLPLGDPTDLVHYDNGSYRGAATYDAMISTPFYLEYQQYGIGVGSSLWLGPSSNASLAVRFNVTGLFGVAPTVLSPTGAFAVLVPLSDLQGLTGFGPSASASVFDAADTLQVAVTGAVATDPSALAHVEGEVQTTVGSYYSVTSLSQEAQQLESASSVLTGFYLALSSVGLTIGLLFLALVLLRRVEADQRAIGIRRALGLPSRMIAADIVRDGLLLAIAGAAVGLLAGYLVVEGIATWATSTVQEAAQLAVFEPVLLAEIAAGVVGLSLLASAVAARSALRVDSVEALR